MNLRFADANENYGGKSSEQERSDCFHLETHNSRPNSRCAPVLNLPAVPHQFLILSGFARGSEALLRITTAC